MRDFLRQLMEETGNDLARVSRVREYLQARLLETLQDSGAFLNWAIGGGTALRFLYSIPRFSEDLDFSTIDQSQKTDFRYILSKVKRRFVLEDYPIEIRVSDQKNVVSARIQFPGLLHDLDLSPHPSQALSIKVELDTCPPSGAVITTSVVRRHVTLNLCHHDKASLLAGKMHAVVSRRWIKGRDIFDLVWYLADRHWPEPNLAMLNAALKQTGWKGPVMTMQNWREQLRFRIDDVDWKQVQADVKPFLERERDIELVSADVLCSLLGEKRRGKQGFGV